MCTALTVVFVGGLYLASGKLHRNHPDAIKRRFIAVALVCVFGYVFASWYLSLDDTTTTSVAIKRPPLVKFQIAPYPAILSDFDPPFQL